MGRTCLNITGDVSCALCVTKWENKKAAKLPSNFLFRNQNAAPIRGGIFVRTKRIGIAF